MTRQIRDVQDAQLALLSDVADQFDLVKSMADGQREFLHGVIEFYQTRTSTQTTIAAEKVASTGVQQNDDMRRITAWVAIVAVPTAVTGFFGQNVPYPGFGTRVGFLTSIILMLIMAVTLYVVFRHKKWL
jgi:magnesium transporter